MVASDVGALQLDSERRSRASDRLLRTRLTQRVLCLNNCASLLLFPSQLIGAGKTLYCVSGRSSLRATVRDRSYRT
jgi:hypothetical protein